MIAIYFPFVQTLSTAAGALVLVLATGQMHSGGLTAGALIAYLLYIDMVFSPIQQLSQVFDGYQQAMVGLRRITDLLRLDTSTPAPRRPVDAGRLRGRIELRDVDFSYGGSEANALSGISLTIAPGETVALVGQTGAGKSTLVKLIARFYDATGGQVLVDGTDVRDYDLASYRHQLGIVPQESYLFAGTVSGLGRVRQAGRQRRRGRGRGPGDRRARHDHPAARRLRPRGGRARPQPVGRPAPAHRAGPRAAGRPRHPAARRGHRGARPGRRGRGERARSAS